MYEGVASDRRRDRSAFGAPVTPNQTLEGTHRPFTINASRDDAARAIAEWGSGDSNFPSQLYTS